MRAERAFRDLLGAALLGTAALSAPLLITLFPGALERALHGYDASTRRPGRTLRRHLRTDPLCR